jgi:hypothetical protein
MRPVDFFHSLAAPFPESSGPADEEGYFNPAFAAPSVIAAALSRKGFPCLVLPDKLPYPFLFVQFPLVKIEIEVAARPQSARHGAEGSGKIGSTRQMIYDSPFGRNQVNLDRQTKRSHIGSTNLHIETFGVRLLAGDPAHHR